MKHILLIGAILALLLASPVSAIGKDAKVRVLHASPDAPAVDVWVNGAPAFTDVEFGEFTDYAKLQKGRYNIDVVPAGKEQPVVIDNRLYLKNYREYTVIALDRLSDIEPLVLQDRNNFHSPNKARVRFVHASPDAPAVDIAIKDGPTIFWNVGFGDDTTYRLVSRGTYDLEVRVAGTDTVALELPGVSFDASGVYTAVALGLLEDGSLSAVLNQDNAHD